jgi:hypothetical protein
MVKRPILRFKSLQIFGCKLEVAAGLSLRTSAERTQYRSLALSSESADNHRSQYASRKLLAWNQEDRIVCIK